MDDKLLTDMFSVIEERFAEMDSAIVSALPERDERYAKLCKEKGDIVVRFPELENWLNGSGTLSLSEEEHAGLAEYMALTAEMEDLERRAIYFAGQRDCFVWLKKIGAI